MKSAPRILPLLGVAIGGVLALNALAGARDLPELLSGARAFAEEAAKPEPKPKPQKGSPAANEAQAASTGEATDAAASQLPPPAIKPQAVCAPTAAELAREAGLSPAELQVLQSLGQRRGQLDQREAEINTQLALLAAAEAKLDAKVKALNGLKTDVKDLLAQADGREAAEVDRLVKVFESMKAKDAAPRMVVLDDSVRLPIAAKMKERSLSAIVAQMPPAEAKKLTEALARRFAAAQKLAASAEAQANGPAASSSANPASRPSPQRRAPARPATKPAAKAAPSKQAAAAPASADAEPKPAAG